MAIPAIESTSRDSSASTTLDILYPSGIVVGDVIIAATSMSYDGVWGGWDSGWLNAIQSIGSDGSGTQIRYKIADGTESGTTLGLSKINVNWAGTVQLMRVSGIDVDDPLHDTGVRSIAGPVSTDYAPSVGIALANSFCVSTCVDADSGTLTVPDFSSGNWVRLYSQRNNTSPSFYSYAFATQVGSTSTGTNTMTGTSTSSNGYDAVTAVFNPLPVSRRIFIT